MINYLNKCLCEACYKIKKLFECYKHISLDKSPVIFISSNFCVSKNINFKLFSFEQNLNDYCFSNFNTPKHCISSKLGSNVYWTIIFN